MELLDLRRGGGWGCDLVSIRPSVASEGALR
jgi:hypothetical protein